MDNHIENIDELLGKYLSDEISDKELHQVMQWINESERNRRYYQHLKLIFDKAAEIKEYPHFDADAAWMKVRSNLKNEKGRVIPMPRRSYSMWYQIAAAVILLLAVGIYLFRSTDAGTSIEPIEVVASKTSVSDTLPDGSDIFLNKETKLVYAYDKNTKTHEVRLKGEAYFNIKNSKREDFIVDAGGVFIRDIGTSFNVKAYPGSDEVEVLVEEGEIVFFTKDNPGIHLKESGKAIYNKTTKKFSIDQPDPNITAYKTKFFVFSGTDLNSMVEALNAVYEKQIVIGEQLKKCTLTVSFRNEPIEEIAAIIAETLSLKMTIQDNSILLEGKGCE